VTSSEHSPYEVLRQLLAASGTPFRELEHPPAASAAEYHGVVGSRLTQQAKALFLRRYRRDGGKDYVVFALPGDCVADLDELGSTAAGSRIRLATEDELHRSTGCRFGELPPVGSIFGAELILDERLLDETELYFNACRLDRSFIVSASDLVTLEQPTIHSVDRRRLSCPQP
jgi:Ala-tRNA(Pro) deacylase